MDFGYDEYGKRLPSDDEEAHVQPVTTAAIADPGANMNEEAPETDSNSDFSDDVELIIGEAGYQDVAQPLVEPPTASRHGREGGDTLLLASGQSGAPTFLIGERVGKATAEVCSYLDTVASVPSRRRNVAMVGSLHHGKTDLLRALTGGQPCHQSSAEEARSMTLKCHVLSSLSSGQNLYPSTNLVTFIDTPGHPDLIGETAAGVRLADAVLFCVDVVESLGAAGEQLLRHVVLREQLPIILVLTKVDRLILDLKLPPMDAYRKMRLTVDAVNNIIAGCGMEQFLVSPENGTVCFSSTKLNFFFSLETFAHKYSAVYPSIVPSLFALKLWGQVTLEKGAFRKITKFTQKPTFVTLILEPLYKIISHAVTGKGSEVLSSDLTQLPRSPLTAMQEAVRKFCGNPSGESLDCILGVLPSTDERTAWLRTRYQLEGCCDDNTVLAISPIQCLKGDQTVSIARILQGSMSVSASSALLVIDNYSNDANPFHSAKATHMFLRTAEGFIPIAKAHAGQVVYLSGLDAAKLGQHLILVGGAAAQAVLCDSFDEDGSNDGGAWLERAKIWPFACGTPTVHVSVELKDPSKLDKLHRGLQLLMHSTPQLDVSKEETGEFTVTGYGETHLDSALHELRRGLCPGVKIGLSQPYVAFSETVLDTEGVLAVAGNRKAFIGCVSGGLDRRLTEAIEYEQINLFPSDEFGGAVKLWTTMRTEYRFDALDARNIIAVGPDKTKGPSMLIDDTLEEELRAPLSRPQKNSIVAGFRAVMSAGPLVGETVRGVGVRLTLADLEADARNPTILTNTRSAVKQSLLGARPRLLEPVLSADILCTPDSIEKVTDILRQRRGAVIGEEAIPATTLVRLKGLVPAMDSFGLETQLRMLTHGQAFPFFAFKQWDVVPGDPYDASIHVAPLEPAKGYQLARDFVLKTRFRKGLPASLTADI